MVSASRDVLVNWSVSVFNIRASILRSFVTGATGERNLPKVSKQRLSQTQIERPTVT